MADNVGLAECHKCGLYGTRVVRSYIPPREDEDTLRVAVIGEAPGSTEVAKGEPFVGVSGELIRETLKEIKLDFSSVMFANACMCKPSSSREPSKSEVACCRPQLVEDIKEFAPDRILTVGATSTKTILGDTGKTMIELRGQIVYSEEFGCYVIPTYHPSAVLRNPDLFYDFSRDVEKLNWPMPVPEIAPMVRVAYNLEDALNIIYCNIIPRTKGSRLRSFDIETTGLDVRNNTVLALGISTSEAVSYIFTDIILDMGPVKDALNEAFAEPHLIWIAHNGISFDVPSLKKLDINARVDFDTMLAHYAIDERNGTHSLKVLGREFFGLPDWSLGEEKMHSLANVNKEELFTYLSLDTAVTYALYKFIKKEVVRQKVQGALEVMYPAAAALADIQQTGALIDTSALQDVGDKLEVEIDSKLKKLREEIHNPSFNVRSPQQVAQLLFREMGLPRIHKDSTEKEVMLELIRRTGNQTVKDIFETRQALAIKTTNVDGILKRISEDGRLRTRFPLHATTTGRLASRDPNLQNIPKRIGPDIRNAFIATPRWKFVEADYSQLELRVAALVSRDQQMLDLFKQGIDIHRWVASRMFKVPEDKVTSDQRFIAKSIDFGAIYERGARALAEDPEVPCNYEEASEFTDSFLKMFPRFTRWRLKQHQYVKKHGFVKSTYGRRRRFPLILPETVDEIYRQSVNTPIQSMASDICLSSLVKLNDILDPVDARIILTVHDSILFEVRDYSEILVDHWITIIRDIMERPQFDDVVQFNVEISTGYRWGSLEKL